MDFVSLSINFNELDQFFLKSTESASFTHSFLSFSLAARSIRKDVMKTGNILSNLMSFVPFGQSESSLSHSWKSGVQSFVLDLMHQSGD